MNSLLLHAVMWLAVFTGAPTASHADAATVSKTIAKQGLFYRHLLGGRLNPPGALSELMLGYRHQFSDEGGPLFNDTYLGLFLHTKIVPMCAGLGASAELQPLTILRVRASYHSWRLCGETGGVTALDSANVDLGSLAKQHMQRGGNAKVVDQLSLTTFLQARVGKFAFRDELLIEYARLNPNQPASSYYYTAAHDTLVHNADVVAVNNLDAFASLDSGVLLGTRYTVTYVPQQHQDARQSTMETQHRAGPLVGYTLWNRPGTSVEAPMLVGVVNWYVKHPYRATSASRWTPYVAVALLMSGTIAP